MEYYSKNMLAAQHGVEMWKHAVRWIIAVNDIINSQMAGSSSLKGRKLTANRRQKKRGNIVRVAIGDAVVER